MRINDSPLSSPVTCPRQYPSPIFLSQHPKSKGLIRIRWCFSQVETQNLPVFGVREPQDLAVRHRSEMSFSSLSSELPPPLVVRTTKLPRAWAQCFHPPDRGIRWLRPFEWPDRLPRQADLASLASSYGRGLSSDGSDRVFASSPPELRSGHRQT